MAIFVKYLLFGYPNHVPT